MDEKCVSFGIDNQKCQTKSAPQGNGDICFGMQIKPQLLKDKQISQHCGLAVSTI